MSSSQSSMMNTRRTYSLMLFRFFFVSKRSKGARRGTKINARNSRARNENQCAELQLSLHAEVFHGQVVFPIVRKRFVEGRVLFVRHVLRLPHPEWFVLV